MMSDGTYLVLVKRPDTWEWEMLPAATIEDALRTFNSFSNSDKKIVDSVTGATILP